VLGLPIARGVLCPISGILLSPLLAVLGDPDAGVDSSSGGSGEPVRVSRPGRAIPREHANDRETVG
jgi:hypothetical protein